VVLHHFISPATYCRTPLTPICPPTSAYAAWASPHRPTTASMAAGPSSPSPSVCLTPVSLTLIASDPYRSHPRTIRCLLLPAPLNRQVPTPDLPSSGLAWHYLPL
jgi:hypothetical protein